MDEYKSMGRAGEGAHGMVYKAMDRKTKKMVALKKIRVNNDSTIPKNTMREMLALRALKSDHIVELLDIKCTSNSVVLVMEYLPCSLAEIINTLDIRITLPQVKRYMKMIFCGIKHLHDNDIMHRDIKPANLLLSDSGVLKIADFGLARIYKKSNIRTYSHQVATRWYRAPELLYGSRTYTPAVDLWGVGCVLAELINRQPLFAGETDIEQLAIVLSCLGTPNESKWPGVTELPDFHKISFSRSIPKKWSVMVPDADAITLDLIKSLVQYDAAKRPSAYDCLNHSFFFERPFPADLRDMPKIHQIRDKTDEKMDEFEDLFKKFSNTLLF